MMLGIAKILSPKDSFMVLNLYSNGFSAMLGETVNGFSAMLGETVVRQAFRLTKQDKMQSGELVLSDRFGKALPLSIFVRLER